MPINPSFNYADKLALDKTRLIERTRINDIGSYELVVQYNLAPLGMREDAVEWLEANRLQVIDPTISFNTYEGTWNSISIGYDSVRGVINQRFKVDVGLGNLGDTSSESDYGLQTGDLARISDGMEVYRAYYWRVSNPTDYTLPDPDRIGEVWTKTANDNGDGTFDITISKEVAQNQTALGAMQFGGANVESDDIEVSEAGTAGVNGTYVLTGTTSGKNYWYNGSYYLSWNTTDGGTWFFSTEFAPIVTWYYKVISTSDIPPTGGWTKSGAASDPTPTLLIGGGAGGPYFEETEINTNDDEQKFTSDFGAISDAIDGQIKTISNTPLENGKFRTSVTTRTSKPLRIPNTEGSFFAYGSDYLVTGKALIVGRNRTYDDLTADSLLLRGAPYLYRINNVSMRINDFGLFDYTITSNEPG